MAFSPDPQTPGYTFLSVLYVLLSFLTMDNIATLMGILVGISLLLLNGAKFIKTLIEKDLAGKSLWERICEWLKKS